MSRPLSRRRFLGLVSGAAAVAGSVAALTGCASTWGIDLRPGQTGELLASKVPLPPPFQVPLPVPPVRRPTGGVIEITQRVAEVEILPGMRTPVFGYDGLFPGPTLETRRGEPVIVRHRNELPFPTTVHLHGGHNPPEDDGWPLDLILPPADPRSWNGGGSSGERTIGSRDYHYPMAQQAATLWYHDHRMDFTGPAVYHGLAGFHLVRDDIEDALPLPRGERELPLLICDRAFAADGSFHYPALDQTMRVPGVQPDWTEGVLGDVVLVNGAPWPVHEVDAARYRLRLLNAANARRFRLALQPALPLVQIGSDGGLLATPVSHAELDIAPAERFDVVVDFGSVPVGTTVDLVNRLGTGRTGQVMRFVVARPARDESRVPGRLAEVAPLVPPAGAVTREFRFTRGRSGDHDDWRINGQLFDPNRSLADVPLGTVERWRFATDLHHSIHVHLDPFQVLRRGGQEPGPYDRGWKDTVDLRPAEDVEVAVRFSDHAGHYLIHCHNLEHEDMAMMGAFRTS